MMDLSEELDERLGNEYPGHVLLGCGAEDLAPGMKVVIKEDVNSKYSQTQDKYRGQVFTLKGRVRYGNGEESKVWWEVEENDSQWFYKSCYKREFIPLVPESEHKSPRMGNSRDPFNENMFYNMAMSGGCIRL